MKMARVVLGAFVVIMAIAIIDNAHKEDASADARQAAVDATRTPEQLAQAARGRAEAEAGYKAAEKKAAALAAVRSACAAKLKELLNDPYSAQIDPPEKWPLTERQDGSVSVVIDGRAKNSFGAYVKGAWQCIAIPEGQVLSFQQVEP